MRRVRSGPYKGYPERFVPVFDEHPRLYREVQQLMERGINLIEDDAYGSSPDPDGVSRLLRKHASGVLPLSALRAAWIEPPSGHDSPAADSRAQSSDSRQFPVAVPPPTKGAQTLLTN